MQSLDFFRCRIDSMIDLRPDQSSSLTSACITLYNELRKTNKLDLAMEQRAIDKIAKEIASDLTKQ